MELDPNTMTITGGDPYQGDSVTLPVAEDVELGNHGDNGLSDFLMWSMLSSYYPMVLEVEVTGGEITAMTWYTANLSTDLTELQGRDPRCGPGGGHPHLRCG